jgi:ribosome-associated heat shock protein Hsp15
MEKVRIDKWLWSVRIFKSRTIAIDACKEGKIKVNGQVAKPSQLIQIGDKLEVKREGFLMQYVVIQLIEKRVSAQLAQVCYEDKTPLEELNKFKDWFVGKAGVEYREKGSGRPTKKDRRLIDDFKIIKPTNSRQADD